MLFDLINDTIQKEDLGEEVSYIPTYPSGIDIMDYRNGRIEHGKLTTGFDGGRIITVIGKSGSGKSTLALKMACSIVEKYKDGNIFHYDFERATNTARVRSISGWDDETIDKKYKNLQRNIYSESIYKIAKAIDKLKNKPETYDEIKLDSGEKDSSGNPIYVLPPTVLLIDSYALMMPEDISEEEKLSGSMSASSIAKVNNSVIKRLVGPLERGNIIMIIINHITTKIEINAFAKTQAAVNYLKQDESLPGGSSLVYLSNNLIRCTTSTKLDEDSTYGIKGFMVKGEFIKSRANEAGRQFEMVFEQSTGFDNVLTNLANFKDLGLLKGSPRAYYLEGCPDIKFTLKTFKTKYEENEELRDEVQRLVEENYIKFIPHYEKFIKNKLKEEEKNIEEKPKKETKSKKSSKKEETIEEVEDDEISLVECVDEEQDVWLGSDGNYYTSEGEEVEYEDE